MPDGKVIVIKMLTDKLKKVLEKYGRTLIAEIIVQLQAVNKYNAKLVNSLNFEISEALGEPGILLYADELFNYINAGRRAGKQPPYLKEKEKGKEGGTSLQVWIRGKGIPVTDSTSFLVARHIGRFGIPPTRFFEKALENTDQQLKDEMTEAVLECIRVELLTQ